MNASFYSIASGSVAIYIVLVISCFVIRDKSEPPFVEFFFSLIIISFGATLAWFIAIIVSPYEPENTRFTSISNGLLGLATGYLAGKSDRLIGKMLDPDFVFGYLESRTVIFRLIAFFISLILTFIVAYAARAYNP